ncbi:Elongation factor 1-gamma [Rhynchospora pubera]|uniref:Elongation factor 1-gamma n=1 Tax=Rhynchospora pubera TaxID=906938 RepID=A0AAV8AT33_9POAL|nr:Elongation factor 1-gamma [Rhynchospora pubera]
MALVLYTGPANPNAFKALITAEYSGVKLELAKDFRLGVSNYTPEFLKMSPIGRVPVLETPDGAIFDSNAIARYVASLKADNPLYGSSLIDHARVEQWIDFAATRIEGGLLSLLWATSGRFDSIAFHANMLTFLIKAFKKSLHAINIHLANNTYLVGHSITLADIVMTCNLYWGYSRIMTKDFMSEFPHVERYFWTMVNQPNFKVVVGEVKQAKAVPAVLSLTMAPTKEQAKPKEFEPKEVKKEASPSKAAEAEEEEAPKPKPRYPLDLPRSKMILDEQGLYSYTKTNFFEVAIKDLCDMHDPEGYSLWFCESKYIEENTLFKAKGLWLFCGQEIPQFVIESYDMELYEWTKVDISDELQKERINAMMKDPIKNESKFYAKCLK